MLGSCRNIYNEPISSEYRKKIGRFFTEPRPDTWDDIARIIIAENGTTIWQAVCAYDPAFPDHTNGISWERVPTPFDVMQAIKKVTS